MIISSTARAIVLSADSYIGASEKSFHIAWAITDILYGSAVSSYQNKKNI